VTKTFVPMKVKMGTDQRAVYQFHAQNKPEHSTSGEEMGRLAAVGCQVNLLRQRLILLSVAASAKPSPLRQSIGGGIGANSCQVQNETFWPRDWAFRRGSTRLFKMKHFRLVTGWRRC